MPDITMCTDNRCKQHKTCYRYLAIPHQYGQSYFMQSPRKGNVCDHYIKGNEIEKWENKKHKFVLKKDVKMCVLMIESIYGQTVKTFYYNANGGKDETIKKAKIFANNTVAHDE